ncbi:MAG: zinc ribbon domain-containing protein [Candidatus Caldarchaeum sp.]
MNRFIIFLLLASTLALIVSAHGQESVVENRYGLPFIVNGRLVDSPVTVSPGTTVCIAHYVHYITAERRLVFTGWSDGTQEPCIKAPQGGIRANYREEVLIIVNSELDSVRSSFWAVKGERVVLETEKIIYRDGFRYVFVRWSRGEQPFNIINTLVAMEPMIVEAFFKTEVKLDVTAPYQVPVNGSGWYEIGYVATVAAPREINLSSDEKLVFTEWTTVGTYPQVIYNPASNVATFEIRRPAVVRAEYDKYYFVNITSPLGIVEQRWAREDETITLSLPTTIEIDPGRIRLVFERWVGDITAQTPIVKTTVKSPIKAQAMYRVEYRVEVKAPAGATGSGWYRPNATIAVNAPDEIQTTLFLKRVLSHYTGDCGDKCTHASPLILTVDSPKYVEAVYVLTVDFVSLSVVAAVASALAITYYFTKTKPTDKKPTPIDDAVFCTECGAKNSSQHRYCLKCGAPLKQVIIAD